MINDEAFEQMAALYPDLRPVLDQAKNAGNLASWMEEIVADDLENFQRELEVYSAEFRQRVKVQAQAASPEEVAQRLPVREKKSVAKKGCRSRVSEVSGVAWKRFLTVEEAAAYLGTTIWQVRTRKWNGDLHPVRMGKRDLYPREDLDRLAKKIIDEDN